MLVSTTSIQYSIIHLNSVHYNLIKFNRPIEYLTFVQNYAATALEMNSTQHLTFKETSLKKVRLKARTEINNMVNRNKWRKPTWELKNGDCFDRLRAYTVPNSTATESIYRSQVIEFSQSGGIWVKCSFTLSISDRNCSSTMLWSVPDESLTGPQAPRTKPVVWQH